MANRKTNIALWSAAALMGLTTGVHLFAGTPEIMGPILQADLHPVIKATAMVVWHVATLLLALMTFGIAYLAKRRNAALSLFIILIQLSFVGLFLWYNITVFSGLFALPQWTVFLVVLALMGYAQLKDA
ncbi:hypothetical protein [Planktotalea sp.]|uniref:hypothetical protein n=1 Tax=Planktotalea sp. TaxID=2029877 RepID=UPI0035C8083B